MLNNSQNIKPGQRLKVARESLKDTKGKKMTQHMFAKRLNYSRNTLSEWEQCTKEIPAEIYPILKDAFSINPHWLRTGEGDMFLPSKPLEGKAILGISGKGYIEAGEPEKKTVISDLQKKIEDTANRFYNHPGIRIWALAGGGNPWIPDENNQPIETIKVENFINPKYRDAFRIFGDSMEPVIRHGGLVFCNFKDKHIRGGEIYALNIPSEGLVVKELRIQKEHVIIYSYNESRYPSFHYTHEEINQGNIIVGRITLIHQETNK